MKYKIKSIGFQALMTFYIFWGAIEVFKLKSSSFFYWILSLFIYLAGTIINSEITKKIRKIKK